MTLMFMVKYLSGLCTCLISLYILHRELSRITLKSFCIYISLLRCSNCLMNFLSSSTNCRSHIPLKPILHKRFFTYRIDSWFIGFRNISLYTNKFKHKFLVERGRWVKPKVPYNERRCTLCNNPDVQDEFHITLCCAKFNSLREKYIKPYYYRRPSMHKFGKLMNTDNRRDLYRLMVFLKLTFKLYVDTLLE